MGTVALIGKQPFAGSLFCHLQMTVAEEDIHGCYSKVIEKYFIAEGVVSKHSVIVGSQDVDPHIIVITDDIRWIYRSFI